MGKIGLVRVTDVRFESDKEQSERSARANIQFILSQSTALLRVRNGQKYLADVIDISKSDCLTPKQKSYIESIYEKVWKGLDIKGIQSCQNTYKPRKKY